MLNKERKEVVDEIINIIANENGNGGLAVNSETMNVCDCDSIMNCDNCLFCNCNNCSFAFAEWFNSEYKEPTKYIDWENVPVDTPILVRDSESSDWERRYFSKYINGHVHAWYDGKTSWSTKERSDEIFWKYVELAREEDKEKYEKIKY